ncbi:MAG: cobaltochelatase subunit CobT, partial [Roseibium sp.]
MAGPGSNSNPSGKSTPSTEPFKQSVTGTIRAIAGEPELEIIFSGDRPGLSGATARLPEPSRKPTAGEVAVTRGLGDSMALKIACHDAKLHARRAPSGPEARAIFEAVEQARCDAVGSIRMEGVADNISAMLDDRYKKANAPEVVSREEAPLQDAIALMVRERLTGAPPPPSATKLVDMWRGWIEEKAAKDLDLLTTRVEDQESFAKQVHQLLTSLEMADEIGDQDQDDDPNQSEDEGNNDEAEAGDDGEEDTGEQEAAPQEMEMSGEEQDAGEQDAADSEME